MGMVLALMSIIGRHQRCIERIARVDRRPSVKKLSQSSPLNQAEMSSYFV